MIEIPLVDLSTARTCLRAYELAHVLGLSRCPDDTEADRVRLAAMRAGHARRWADEPLDIVDVPFALDLAGARVTGTLAVVRLHDGRSAVLESVTTREDVSYGGDWLRTARRDVFAAVRVHAARVLGFSVESSLYDAQREPWHKVGEVPLRDDQGCKIVLDAAGQRVTRAGGRPRQTASPKDGWVLQMRPETAEEFGARLAEALDEYADRYYARVEVARSAEDVAAAVREVGWLAQRVVERVWSRNSGACAGCQFDSICEGVTLKERVPGGFERG